jgi:hypothetical protein
MACFYAPPAVAKKVKRISIDSNNLASASFAGMHNLTTLSLANNTLETMPVFHGCKKLSFLNLSKNHISCKFVVVVIGRRATSKERSFLFRTAAIECNAASLLAVAELGRLAELTSLEQFDFSHNHLDFDLQQLYFFLILPLKHCHGLKSLDLSHNPSEKKSCDERCCYDVESLVLTCARTQLIDDVVCRNIDDFEYFVISELSSLEFINGRAVTKDEHKKAEKLSKQKWQTKVR